MFGDDYSADVLITVDGSPLAQGANVALDEVVVDARRGAPATFVIRFSDGAGDVLTTSGMSVGSTVVLSVQLDTPGGPFPLLSGTVTTVETEFGPDGRMTTVRGMDHAYRLIGARRYASYVNMTASDIAREVASTAGLTAKVESTAPVLPYVVQPNVTDWEFLQRLAVESGTSLYVEAGVLVFGAPTDAASGPSAADGARTSPLVMENGSNVRRLRATVTAASQVKQVEARGWDPGTKRALVATVSASTKSASLATQSPARLGAQGRAPTLVVSSAAHSQQSQVDSFAKSVADRVAGGFAELDVVVLGNPKLMVGVAVALKGFGAPFDGKYAVSAARHEFSAGGYSTTVIVSDAADRSLYGLVQGSGARAGHMSGPEVVPAIVTDIKDPAKLGRVRVQLPSAGDEVQTWWARVVQTGAGSGRGLTLLPEVNDEVLVVLTEGGVGQPYVLGGLYNGKDVPRGGWGEQIAAGEVVRRSLTSRTGMFVEFAESNGEESVVMSSADGKQCLSIVTKPDAAVKVVSSGPIDLTAQQDVTIKGVKVSIEGTSEISLSAPTIKVAANGALDLEGAEVKVAAEGMATLSSNGLTVVRGPMVQIN